MIRQCDPTLVDDFNGPNDFLPEFLSEEVFVLQDVPRNKLDDCHSSVREVFEKLRSDTGRFHSSDILHFDFPVDEQLRFPAIQPDNKVMPV